MATAAAAAAGRRGTDGALEGPVLRPAPRTLDSELEGTGRDRRSTAEAWEPRRQAHVRLFAAVGDPKSAQPIPIADQICQRPESAYL